MGREGRSQTETIVGDEPCVLGRIAEINRIGLLVSRPGSPERWIDPPTVMRQYRYKRLT